MHWCSFSADRSLHKNKKKSRSVSLKALIARLQNHNPTDAGNVNFRSLKKIHIQSSESKYKVVDLLVQKLSNDMTLN